jgi:hypothetical protein
MNRHFQPDEITCTDDPGDDTQLRFRYQAIYAAQTCLSMLDDNSEIQCIYCEHHEDILVERKDHSWIGIQIKTRQPINPFTAKDEKVCKSIKRFVELEAKFPGDFLHYFLVVNCDFWKVKKDGSNLNFILDLAKNCDEQEVDKAGKYLTEFLKKIANLLGDDGIQHNILILQTLKKIKLEVSSGLYDIDSVLINSLHERLIKKDCDLRHDQIKAIAQEFITMCFNAASLANNSSTAHHHILYPNPENRKEKMIIAEKKITLDSLLKVIDKLSSDEPYFLRSSNFIPLDKIPMGTKVMERKMAVAGLSCETIINMRDNKLSVEHGLIEFSRKFGRRKRDKTHEHLTAIVSNECQAAYDLTYSSDKLFGKEMLHKIRERLETRYNADKSKFFGFEYEHLLGIVSLLTEQCKVWWSDKFPIDQEE